VTEAGVQRAIEAVWRIESARLIAGLARMVRDVGLAEDLAQDALVAALERRPESGVPGNPGAWLMATAKNRAIDLARRHTTYQRKEEELARAADS
jgi:predicted RNA polymerase sigma factor